MATAFVITSATNTVLLGGRPDRHGRVHGHQPDRTRRPCARHAGRRSTPTQAGWLTLAGLTERDYPIGGTEQLSVTRRRAPARRPQGRYPFRLDVVVGPPAGRGLGPGPGRRLRDRRDARADRGAEAAGRPSRAATSRRWPGLSSAGSPSVSCFLAASGSPSGWPRPAGDGVDLGGAIGAIIGALLLAVFLGFLGTVDRGDGRRRPHAPDPRVPRPVADGPPARPALPGLGDHLVRRSSSRSRTPSARAVASAASSRCFSRRPSRSPRRPWLDGRGPAGARRAACRAAVGR